MSSSGEEERVVDPAATKRKAHRPCDMCRTKKSDGGKPCERCVKYDFVCSYQQKAMQRVPSSSYVRSLETRLKIVEALLRELNVVPAAGSPHSSEDTLSDGHGSAVQLVTQAIRALNSPLPPPDSDALNFRDITDNLQSLSINNSNNQGFQGKSSQAVLVKAVVDLKTQTTSSLPSRPAVTPPSKPWRLKPWLPPSPLPTFDFPPEDLMISLIALYFSSVNTFFPLLHWPTFEKSLATNQHLSDHGFASTLLLVCALGARYSDDPRVHLLNASFGPVGSQWFDQVKLKLCEQPTLYDLQCFCLTIEYLDRTSGPRACWALTGSAIRLSLDIGAHKQKIRTGPITPEEELEKRAFCILALFDVQFSAALGRALAIQEPDYDLDAPIRCDDEYWVASSFNAAFQQPGNKPSLVDFIHCELCINRILAFAVKILYSTNRISGLIGFRDDAWEEKVVMEFDSSMNEFLETVPPHLRWDPARSADDVFFDQSAALYCSFYLTQILIHRPFIPAVRPAASQRSFPSLSICNSAARACSHVAAIHQQRRPNNPLPFSQTAVFTSGIVLLLNIWGGNHGGRVQDADLSDVHRCISVMHAYSEHWPSAAPLLDILEQLIKVDHVPLSPEPSPFAGDVPPPSTYGLPKCDSIFAWPEYNPALETATDYSNNEMGLDDWAMKNFPNTLAVSELSSATPRRYSNENPADMDMDVAVWAAVPGSFGLSDWDSYLNSVMQQTGHH
ncbi:fungal-specific transcription factor domain-containing protein [Mycena polygramma]|nr:fungal-specific transcription factor domain-containing protein [Mycena polygramma]